MNLPRILKIKCIVFLSIYLLAQVVVCDSTDRKKRDNETHPPVKSDKSSSNDGAIHPTSNKNPPAELPATDKTPVEKKSNSKILTSNTTGTKPANGIVQNTSETGDTTVNGGHLTTLNSGALKRGFYVLIGLSVFVIAYFVFRSFRVTKTRAQMIRKYGILAHRQDVEMRPLPLDEDDEDDTTVFDVSNMSAHNTLQTRP
ncbi:membrane protein FAM174-like [Belonocnema kinseyi]|uniref:membrane protein FAM174-like n=1 Tax=Belonocnema kinseyi TaxID=2817044 RepID=UPI00143CF271|nr:membrane protein FAM174-like [Belonocnema kinseyi]